MPGYSPLYHTLRSTPSWRAPSEGDIESLARNRDGDTIQSHGLWSSVKQTARAALPSPVAAALWPDMDPPIPPAANRIELRHLDGVRGVAAIVVFIEHFVLPFYLHGIVGDLSRAQGVWVLAQRPVLRAVYNGGFAVAVFFVMSGMVLSVLPLRTSADPAKSLRTISSAAFRRPFRILIPPAVIVLVVAIPAHFRVFERVYPGRPNDFYVLSTPSHLPTVAAQLGDAVLFLLAQLAYPASWLYQIRDINPQNYGIQLWTISVECAASQVLFVGLFATIPLRPWSRAVCLTVLAVYTMWCGRWEIAFFFAGALLAAAYVSRAPYVKADPHRAAARLRRVASHASGGLLILAGLWAGSIPDYNAEVTPGFQTLWLIVPYTHFWRGVGAVLLLGAITWWEPWQAPFHLACFQYMGRISFSFYLVHYHIIVVMGYPLGHDWRDRVSDASSPSLMPHVVVGAAGLLAFLTTLWVADIFWRLVELPCVRAAKYLESTLSEPTAYYTYTHQENTISR